MNTHDNVPQGGEASANCPPPPESTPVGPARDWRYWTRRLLVCNPFFLCSAALLLYAINRLSVDPNFLSDETQNLLFNFSALQVYELLLICTAILLRRRKVWYDSALLVVLDGGLVLVPFMLITQANLIDRQLATILSIAGGLAVAGRLLGVRRLYPEFNLPSRALLLGLLILGVNLALPRIFREIVELDYEGWLEPNKDFVVLDSAAARCRREPATAAVSLLGLEPATILAAAVPVCALDFRNGCPSLVRGLHLQDSVSHVLARTCGLACDVDSLEPADRLHGRVFHDIAARHSPVRFCHSGAGSDATGGIRLPRRPQWRDVPPGGENGGGSYPPDGA